MKNLYLVENHEPREVLFYPRTKKREEKSNIEKVPVFKILEPFMIDARGATTKKVSYQILKRSDQGFYTFKVVPNSDWLNEEHRAFPVTVDPTIILPNEGWSSQIKTKFIGTFSYPDEYYYRRIKNLTYNFKSKTLVNITLPTTIPKQLVLLYLYLL